MAQNRTPSRQPAHRRPRHALRAPVRLTTDGSAVHPGPEHRSAPRTTSHIAQRVNLAAINDVEATGLTKPAQRVVFIQMLSSAAYAAAHSGDRDRALELAAEADHALRGLPERPAHPATPVNATALTRAQVQLYKVGMYWALGDSAAALDSARGIQTPSFMATSVMGKVVGSVYVRYRPGRLGRSYPGGALSGVSPVLECRRPGRNGPLPASCAGTKPRLYEVEFRKRVPIERRKGGSQRLRRLRLRSPRHLCAPRLSPC